VIFYCWLEEEDTDLEVEDANYNISDNTDVTKNKFGPVPCFTRVYEVKVVSTDTKKVFVGLCCNQQRMDMPLLS
jgi:hypothetical protein